MDGRVLSRSWRLHVILCAALAALSVIAFGPTITFSYGDTGEELIAREQIHLNEQERFYREEFEPALLVGLRTYPVASIRTRLIEVIDALQADRIVLGHRSDYSWNRPDAFAEAARFSDGRLLIVFELPGFYERFPLWRREGILDDTLAEILLHEYFHIQHHVEHITVPDTLERFRADESEAWLYTCGEVLRPMLQAGRFPHGKMDGVAAEAYKAYTLTGGVPTDPRWSDLIARLYPSLPPSGE